MFAVTVTACRVRPWELDPVVVTDAGVATMDLPALVDLSPPLSPCHLTPNGPVIETLKFSDKQSPWHADGLLRRSGSKHVVQSGTVQLRFGGWSDPAIHAREYDTTSWPPTAIAADTELAGSVHSPIIMFEQAADQLGAVWFTDNDGGGPSGIKYRSVTAGSWTLGPEMFILPDNALLTAAVAFPGGDRFAILTMPFQPTGKTILSVFARDGSLLQKLDLAMPPLSGRYALERTDTDLLLVAAPGPCGGDMGGCAVTSIGVYRINGATATAPITLDLASSIPAPISGALVMTPILVTDHAQHHVLTWWELSSQQASTLYALPLGSDGKPVGLAEVWFHTALPVTSELQPSVGPMGIVYPFGVFVPSDGGTMREVHLLQRQLVDNEPVTDTTFVTELTSYGISTVQLENPRTLIVGYSDYYPAPTYGGTGKLARYLCSEDQP